MFLHSVKNIEPQTLETFVGKTRRIVICNIGVFIVQASSLLMWGNQPLRLVIEYRQNINRGNQPLELVKIKSRQNINRDILFRASSPSVKVLCPRSHVGGLRGDPLRITLGRVSLFFH